MLKINAYANFSKIAFTKEFARNKTVNTNNQRSTFKVDLTLNSVLLHS